MSRTVVAFLLALVPQIAFGQVGYPSSDLLEDQLEILIPKSVRTEADEDRLLAAAQFSHARMLLQREQYPAALRGFQRSFRNDPSPAIARDIMGVASELKRHAEAVRYAVQSAEIETPEGDLPLRLAAILAEQGQHNRAVRLLENAVQRAPQPPKSLSGVLTRAEMLRLYLVTEQFELASKSADVVRDALQQPAQFDLSSSDQKKLKAQGERLYALIAESYLLANRLADAESAFRRGHEIKPNEAILNLGLARVAAEQKNWPTARERLAVYFSQKSTAGGLEPYELLSWIIVSQTGDEERAKQEVVVALQELRKQDPSNDALGYFTASKLLAANKLDESAKLYEELISRKPTTTAYRDLVQIYRRQKNAAALLRVVAQAIGQGSSRDIFGAEGQKLAQDVAVVNALIAVLKSPAKEGANPHTASAYVAGSLLTIDMGKIDVARELYEKALNAPESDPEKIRETIGLAALVSNQHGFAADVLREAIAAQPPEDKLAAYNFYLSGALEFAKDTEGALAAAEKCASLKRDSALFQARPAWVLYHAKRLDDAERRYRELISRFDLKYESEEVRDQMRQARLILSNICVLKKRLPEAEEWLEQVLDEFPENVGALNDLGYLWADQGKRLRRALKMIEQAVAVDSDNVAYRDSLGWAYYRLGRYDEAIRELERAAAAAGDGVIYDHLGDVYLKLENRDQALAAWRKGIELMTDPEEETQRAAITAKINQYSKTTK